MSGQFSEFDLIQAISGRDKYGCGKCSIGITPQRCDAEGKVVNTDDEYVTEKPVVQMFKQAGGYVLVDLIFESINDVDLHRLYAYFQTFFSSTNSISDESRDFPLLVVSFVPKALNGEFWALGLNPVFYALAPDDMHGEPKILRLAFATQENPDAVPNFLFLKSNKEILDKIIEEETGEKEAEFLEDLA